MTEDCREKILSNDYADLIWDFNENPEMLQEVLSGICMAPIGPVYHVIHIRREFFTPQNLGIMDYQVVPSCYTVLDTESLQQSGILRVQNQPVLNLKGRDVILGFLDTGIDYENMAFRSPGGASRILEIWDQTIQSGEPPEGISYGSVYTRADINAALNSDTPKALVPTEDREGHGTRLASIAAGSENEEQDFTGAAPECDIAVVKLKQAKPYLLEFYAISPDTLAFSETDIMMGLRYLDELAKRQNKPLVICMALGTNQGDHAGNSPLGEYLEILTNRLKRAVVTAGGNEANQGHHFFGRMNGDTGYEDVEVRVAEGEYGFTMELWGTAPDVFSVSIVSPTGEEIPRIPARLLQHVERQLLFEETRITLDGQVLETRSGDQLIVMRFQRPTAGVWRIRVYADRYIYGTYHIWLPITGFLSPGTVFLRSNPDTTLTEPSNAERPITVSAYNGNNSSIYLDSGRGYTRLEQVKPDIAAPGVEVSAVGVRDRATQATGTSASAALTAGAAALMMEWGIVRGNAPAMDGLEIKKHFIRGADRRADMAFPNREWGYGTLNLYESFEAIRRG